MNIGIIGAGYVGLVTGTCLASLGFKVTILDNNPRKIKLLKAGKVPFYEPDLEGLIRNATRKHRLTFTHSLPFLLRSAQIYFLCVGTPAKKNGSPNMSFINKALNGISEHFVSKNNYTDRYLFIKSTVPPLTLKKAEKKFSLLGLKKFHFGFNPEFLREGSAVFDFFNQDRIIVGTRSKEVHKIAIKLYRKIISIKKIVFVKPESAEIIKYGANAFLATKISFINEIAKLSEAVKADINEISSGIGLDNRINHSFLNAGIGFGGSCFPKDTLALDYEFNKRKIKSEIVRSVITVNDRQKYFFLEKIFNYYNSATLLTKNVLLLGTAFKSNTDDIRESVGIKIARILSSRVRSIEIFEPYALENTKSELGNIKNIQFHEGVLDISNKFDFLVICTEHNQFKKLPIKDLLELNDKVIFDGRNLLSKELLSRNGIKYYGMGL